MGLAKTGRCEAKVAFRIQPKRRSGSLFEQVKLLRNALKRS